VLYSYQRAATGGGPETRETEMIGPKKTPEQKKVESDFEERRKVVFQKLFSSKVKDEVAQALVDEFNRDFLAAGGSLGSVFISRSEAKKSIIFS
jgi:hypothetical protein